MKRALLLFCLFLSCFFSIAVRPNVNTPRLSIGFVKNVGQWLNQKGEASTGVVYLYQNGSLNIQLREKGFSYELVKSNNEKEMEDPMKFNQNPHSSTKIHRIDIDFVGASRVIEKLEMEEGEGQLIFHSKQDISQSNTLNHYKRILYKNVYPKIDIEFLIDNNSQQSPFKYNIILHPRADVSAIKFKINGTEQTKITASGELEILTSLGNLKENIPLSYELIGNHEIGKSVEAKYVALATNLIGFSVGKRDNSKTLVIDPIGWCTYFGGDAYEFPSGIAFDNLGNIFVTGRTGSAAGLATTGAYQTTFGGGSNTDTYIAKFTGSGNLVWATYLGGSGLDNVNDIGIDKFNNVVVCGSTNSTTGISSGLVFQPALAGDVDGFVSKFSTSGAMIWSTYLGYSSSDQIMGLAFDLNADIYITGYTSSTNTLPGAYQPNNAGASDVLMVKISSTCSLLYATYYGGPGSDYAADLWVDKNNNVYFAGYGNSTTGMTTTGTYKPAASGNMDGIFAKFNSLGQLVYGSYYGGTNNDYFIGMEVDADGNLIYFGYTNSTTGIYISGGYQNAFGGGTWDGLVLKVDTAGIPQWASFVGGASNDYTYGAVSDANSDIYIVGGTASTDKIATIGASQPTNSGGSYDGFIIKLSKIGVRLSGTYFGGTGSDFNRECTINSLGDLIVTGETTSSAGIATTGAHQTVLNGVSDIYVYRLSTTSLVTINNNTISPNQGLCLGNAAQTLIGTTPTGGDGNFNYQWLSSLTGLAGSFSPASGANSNDTYLPGALTVNMYYKRVVLSGTQQDTSNMISIIVGTNLSAGFVVNKTIQCVKTNQFIFSDTTTSSAGTLSYYWDFGNGKTSINQVDTVVYDFAVNNGYQVKLVTSLNGGCADTSVLNVYTISNPISNTINGKDTVVKGTTEVYNVTGTVGSSYNWLFSNGIGRSNTNTISIKWTQVGDVQLKMVETNSGSCLGDTAIKNIYVKQPTSEEELFGSNLSIYPNPSEGVFYIENGESQEMIVQVFDGIGKSVYFKTILSAEPIDLTAYEAGMYVLMVSNTKGESYHKMIQLIH